MHLQPNYNSALNSNSWIILCFLCSPLFTSSSVLQVQILPWLSNWSLYLQKQPIQLFSLVRPVSSLKSRTDHIHSLSFFFFPKVLLWILIDSQLKCKILLTWHELGTSFSSFISSYSVHPQINELLSTPYLFPNVLFSSPRNSPSVFVSLCCTHYVGSQFPLPYLLSVATLEALFEYLNLRQTPLFCASR